MFEWAGIHCFPAVPQIFNNPADIELAVQYAGLGIFESYIYGLEAFVLATSGNYLGFQQPFAMQKLQLQSGLVDYLIDRDQVRAVTGRKPASECELCGC